MMGQMSLDDWVEKNEKKNDQDEVDGMIEAGSLFQRQVDA